MALNRTFGLKGHTKSDLRYIRNLFSHPDQIDCYDLYHLKFEDGTVIDMDAEGLIKMTSLMFMKLVLLQGLTRVLFDLRVYELLLSKKDASNR